MDVEAVADLVGDNYEPLVESHSLDKGLWVALSVRGTPDNCNDEAQGSLKARCSPEPHCKSHQEMNYRCA